MHYKNPVPTLSPSHYLEPIAEIHGYSSLIHKAMLWHPTERRTAPYYIKLFASSSKGIANEIIGWTMATIMRLPQPASIAVILLPVEAIRTRYPQFDLSGWEDDTYPALAVEEVRGPTPGRIHARPPKPRRLQQWTHIHTAIALNTALGNADANAGNIVEPTPNNFFLVDWAEIIGGQNWTKETLSQNRYINNKLIHLTWPGGIPHLDRAAILNAASGLFDALFYAIAGACFEYLQIFCEADEAIEATQWLSRRTDRHWLEQTIQ